MDCYICRTSMPRFCGEDESSTMKLPAMKSLGFLLSLHDTRQIWCCFSTGAAPYSRSSLASYARLELTAARMNERRSVARIVMRARGG